jgi:hypothetical protein
VAEATRLVAGASGATLDGGVRFPDEFSVTSSAFVLGQVLNFGTMAYIADCYGELCPLDGTAPASSELLASPTPPGLLVADLDVLAHQIHGNLGPNPTVSERRQMFYMLANIPPLDRFMYYLPDLPFGIHNVAASFQMELEHLISCEVPHNTILFGSAGTDIPSLRFFLEILSREGSDYDSNNIDHYASPRACFHTDSEAPYEGMPEPALLNQGSCSRMNCSPEKGNPPVGLMNEPEHC